MWQRLPTRERLGRFGVCNDTQCCLCGLSPESHSHLFFQCNISSVCLHQIKFQITCLANDIYQLTYWLQRNCKHRPFRKQVYAAAIAATCYHLWKARNDSLWNKTDPHVDNITKEIQFTVKNRITQIVRQDTHTRDLDWFNAL